MQVPIKQDGSETVRYNDPRFPFYVHDGVLSRYDGYSAISHWHDDLEFIVVRRGHMWYQVNGQEIYLEEGQGIFVNSRQLHFGFSKDMQECHFACVLLHPSLLAANGFVEQEYVTPLLGGIPWLHLKPELPWQAALLEQIGQAEALNDLEEPAIAMHISALTMFSLLHQNLPGDKKQSPAAGQTLRILKNMIRFIQEHYSERISLAQIASAGNVSKTSCGGLFRKHTGLTPVEYLTQYRLQQARAMLTGTDAPVTQIAMETGFGGSSYFCEVFRRECGMTPVQFRRSAPADNADMVR